MSRPLIKSTRTFSWRISHVAAVMVVMAAVLVAVATPTAAGPVAPHWEQLGADLGGEAGGDERGKSVAMSSDGNTVVIGTPYNEGTDFWAGHTRVYRWNGTSWVQVGGDIDGEAAYDRSGWSVAMSGDGSAVIIGAPNNCGTGPFAGHARVYRWNDTAWVQVGGDLDGEAGYDESGYSVAMSGDGDTVIVGAPQNSASGRHVGHARVYRWDGAISDWVQVGGDIDGQSRYDYSGESVAMSSDGDTVIIGAPSSPSSPSKAGHARVYRWSRTSSSWVQRGVALDGVAAGDEFASAVAMSRDGDTVIIGAPYNDGTGTSAGHARVYRWNDTTSTWVQVGGDLDGEAAGDERGYSVAMSSDGDTVIIGAPYNDGSGTTAGHARVYRWNDTTSTWVQVGGDIDGEAANEHSGYSVAMSSDGNSVIVGALLNDGTGINNAGYARVFRLVVDSDGDGVMDSDDLCAGTVIPDPTIPTRRLGTNRWALVDGDGAFDTFHPTGKAPTRAYTIVDTAGCNAEQIANALRLGTGHHKYGLSGDAINRWVDLVGH